MISLRELLLSESSIGMEAAPGNNFFGCKSMELRGFYELKRLVIGNFCFRYANNAVIEDMPELETLVLGDDCLNFSVLLRLISNTKLER